MASKRIPDVLTTSTQLLEQINRELQARDAELSPDVRALLAQKGAVTQVILRELMRLMEDTARQAQAYETLLEQCRGWRDRFLIPLRDQSDGKPMAEAIYLSDLVDMIQQLSRVLGEGEAP